MCCECLCYLVNVHIPSVLRTSSSSSWSVVVAAVDLAGASAVDVCSLLLLILLLSPHTHHITNNSFQVVVIFVSVVLFWSPLQRGLYRRRNFEGFLCKWMGTSSEYGVAFAAFLLSIIYDCGLILFADLFQRASLFSDLLPFML